MFRFPFSKKKKVSISAGEIFRWKKGLKLRCLENSTFRIPGALFPPDIPIGKIMEISDGKSELQFLSDPAIGPPLPDIQVKLNAGVNMKLNRNSEVFLVPAESETKSKVEFVIVEEGEEE